MTRSLDQALIQASKRNRIVNPGMRISQERGAAAGAFSGYLIDGWQGGTGTTTAVTSSQQVAVPTPGGSTHRLRVTVTTGSADNTYAVIGQRIEGIDLADLRFGTASAKTATLRMGVKAPAGQYSVQVSNAASNRVFLAPVTISAVEANTDVVRTVTIPGDVTGTWATDNTTGIVLQFAFGSGGGQGVAGWQSGFPLTLAGQTNGLATTGNVFELFDVGLYEGVSIPPFELPSYDDDLRKCQRYFEKIEIRSQAVLSSTIAESMIASGYFKSSKRAVPTITLPTVDNATIVVDRITADFIGVSLVFSQTTRFMVMDLTSTNFKPIIANARL